VTWNLHYKNPAVAKLTVPASSAAASQLHANQHVTQLLRCLDTDGIMAMLRGNVTSELLNALDTDTPQCTR